jgi:hypothetical protein
VYRKKIPKVAQDFTSFTFFYIFFISSIVGKKSVNDVNLVVLLESICSKKKKQVNINMNEIEIDRD